MNVLEAAVMTALALLALLAVFAVTVAFLTLGSIAIALFAAGILLGWSLPRPRP